MTPKQDKFCREYMKTGNASEAYRNSYNASKMKDATIWNKASDLLKKDEVRARVEELNKEIKDVAIAEVSDLQKFWTDTLNDEELSYQFRLKASELLGKSKAAFIEKHEHKVESVTGFIIETPDEKES